MLTVNEQIGSKIRLLRKEAGLKQEDFGKLFGMSQNRVTNIETGKSALSFEELLAFADYFKVPTDYILKENGVREDNPSLQFVCDVTGLSLSNIKNLEALQISENGFIDFLNMLIEEITANDTLLDDFDTVRDDKTTYIIAAESLIGNDITKVNSKNSKSIEAVNRINSFVNEVPLLDVRILLEQVKYSANGVSYEIVTAINRIFEKFTLSNAGYNTDQFEKLQQELKQGDKNE